MAPNTNYSFCLTSCRRPDLLKQTLESFFLVCDQEPQELLIYEDSGEPMPEWLKADVWRSRGVRWIAGKARMGQAFACAQLIRETRYDFVFWCEEDWLFQRQQSPFIRESKQILADHPEIVQVSLRGETGWHPLTAYEKRGQRLKIAEPYWRGIWGGWSWNPGLRRRETLLKILPKVLSHVGQKGLDHEGAVSKELLDAGYRIADLGRPVVTHLGGGRSRAIEELPPLPKVLIAIPTCFKFDYEGRWEHKGDVRYGIDMHVSGPNDQTQAVRETWAKDAAKFKNVDVKFFYGKPVEGFPRQPLSDEVFLDVPDGYGSLPQKSVAVFDWSVKHGYEFTFKCDTDTYVFPDRLLIELMENRFDYAGFLHSAVCSGGPGYWLSRHAAEIVATQGGNNGDVWAEDVWISRVLAKNGIVPLMLPGHRSGMSAHFFYGAPDTFDSSKLTDDIVTMHAVFPKQMRETHEFIQKVGQST